MSDENIIQILQDIAAMKESLKSAHKRINENDALTAQIHKLAIAVETLTMQVKTQNDHMEKVIKNIEQGQKSQGERIGVLEKAILTISRNEKTLDEHGKRLDVIAKAPAEKWEKFTWLVFTGVAMAIVGFIMGQFL